MRAELRRLREFLGTSTAAEQRSALRALQAENDAIEANRRVAEVTSRFRSILSTLESNLRSDQARSFRTAEAAALALATMDEGSSDSRKRRREAASGPGGSSAGDAAGGSSAAP